MKKFINDIIAQKTPCYFLSPHFDDAALSCGGLISFLADKTDVTVITVFTKGGKPPYTLSAKKALQDSEESDAALLYSKRKEEDNIAFSSLGVKTVLLGEKEALYRKKESVGGITALLGKVLPECTHLYPTYRFHIATGTIHAEDHQRIKRIKRKLNQILPTDALLFAPIGIGNHVDHVVTKTVALKRPKTVFWYDQPYYSREHPLQPRPVKAVPFVFDKKKKRKLIHHYQSQVPLLFSTSEIPELQEYYLLPQITK